MFDTMRDCCKDNNSMEGTCLFKKDQFHYIALKLETQVECRKRSLSNDLDQFYLDSKNWMEIEAGALRYSFEHFDLLWPVLFSVIYCPTKVLINLDLFQILSQQ